MAIYAGIDPSISCTGIALVEYDIESNSFKLLDKKSISPSGKLRGYYRSAEAFELFKFMFETYSIYDQSSFYVFENYSYGSPGKLAELGELGGMYKNYIDKTLKKPFDVIPPQTVKKALTGSGRADKAMVKEGLEKYVSNLSDFTFQNYDESDAVAVAIAYGLNMLSKMNESKEN